MKTLSASLLLLFALLAAGADPAVEPGRDHVVIVLDGSGSMGKTMDGTVKMDAAKNAIAEVLRSVPPGTSVGLLVFSDAVRGDGWVHPLGPRDDARLLAALRPIRPAGGTPLGEYLKRGADRLLEERERQMGYGTYRLLVVTDGEATDGNLTELYAPAILARGIRVDTIGVDMKSDHTLATRSSAYRRANDLGSLRQAVAEALGEIGAGDPGLAPEEGFGLVAGLPDDAVPAILEALDNPDNAPIGAGPADEPAPPSAAPSAVRASPPPSAGGGLLAKAANAVAVVLFVLVVISVAMARARR
jgi:hypothetical protein